MLKKNATKQKIKAGETVIGCSINFSSPFIVEVLGKCGLDFVYFDCEHGPMNEETCEQMVRAAELTGLTPLVRVPSNKADVILRYLDLGALGVIIPHCHNKQEAQDAVRAVKYPPEGDRGIGGRLQTISSVPIAEYIKNINEETLVVIMIEDPEAVDSVPDILTVNGVDVLFVGRLDFSISLGIPGQCDHDLVKEAVDKVISQARLKGKAVGVGAIDVANPVMVKQFIRQGAQLFALSATSILVNASKQLIQEIKSV